MSIFDETGQNITLTDGERALDLFTDRKEITKLFVSKLNDDTLLGKIMFLYGDGGNGKSLLLKYLKKYYCKTFDKETWEYLWGQDHDVFREHIKNSESDTLIPTSFIDFGSQPGPYLVPKDSFSVLFKIRRDLSRFGMKFPIFDYVAALYLYKSGRSNEIKNYFPADEVDFATGLVDIFMQNSYASLGKSLVSVFNKHLGEKFSLYMYERKVKDEVLEKIRKMDAEIELIKMLPEMFAYDLNIALRINKKINRVVLFFDTHEAFWGNELNLSEDIYFERDEWLRKLIGSLELKLGIIVVIAGRDKPKWNKVLNKTRIPEQYIEDHHIDFLDEEDAMDYLLSAGVEDIELCNIIVNTCKADDNKVHPFYLALSAETVLQAKTNNETLNYDEFAEKAEINKNRIINRFFRYVNNDIKNAIIALSAAIEFDKELYTMLGKKLNFATYEGSFETIVDFSFVWSSVQKPGYYKIHDLLKKIFRERKEEILENSHKVLREHYKSISTIDKSNIVKSLYHYNNYDFHAGINEWVLSMSKALDDGDFNLCKNLMDVHLSTQSVFDFGLIMLVRGDYYFKISMLKEAELYYNTANEAFMKTLKSIKSAEVSEPLFRNIVITLNRLASAKESMHQYDKSLELLSLVTSFADIFLNKNKESKIIYFEKVHSMLNTATIYSFQLDDNKARKIYANCLKLSEDKNFDVNIQNYVKSISFYGLGNLEKSKGRYSLALENYEKAAGFMEEYTAEYTSLYDKVMRIMDINYAIFSIQMNEGNYQEAEKYYKKCLDSIIDIEDKKNSFRTIKIKANLLAKRARIFLKNRDNESYLDNCNKAIELLKEYVKGNPYNIGGSIELLDLSLIIAEMHLEHNYLDAAEDILNGTYTITEDISIKYPGYEYISHYKARALQLRAEICEKHNSPIEALEFYDSSIKMYNDSISKLPKYLLNFKCKAEVYRRMAVLKGDENKEIYYQKSIDTLGKAVKNKNRGGAAMLDDRGNTYGLLGIFKLKRKDYSSAFDYLNKSINDYTAYIKDLESISIHPEVLTNRALTYNTMVTLGEESGLSLDKIIFYCKNEIANYEEYLSLKGSVDDKKINKELCRAYYKLGRFHKDIDKKEAVKNFKMCHEYFNNIRNLDITDNDFIYNHVHILEELGDLQRDEDLAEADKSYFSAVEISKKLSSINPKDEDNYYNCAIILEKLTLVRLELIGPTQEIYDLYSESINTLEKLLEINPNDFQAHRTRGSIILNSIYMLKQMDAECVITLLKEAKRHFNKFLEKSPDDAEVLELLDSTNKMLKMITVNLN